MVETVRLSGFKELDDAMKDLSTGVQRGVLRRALIEAAQPMARTARRLAPKDEFDLSESITVSSKLSPRQAAIHRRMFKSDKASAEVFVGPGALPQAPLQEFGTFNQEPQPFMRPAWAQHKRSIIEALRLSLADDISKAIKRAERKAARAK